jgi:hypothetical protein
MRTLPLFLICGLLWSGCDRPEQIPAYLKIAPFVVDAPGGTAVQELRDAWVYINGELIGAFTLPAEVPVLITGEVELNIIPGVTENGNLETPGFHPFFEIYSTKVTLAENTDTPVNPTTKYFSNVIFPWSLDESTFDADNSVIFEDRDADNEKTFVVTTDGALTGKSLLLEVDTAHTIMEIATEAVPLPIDASKQTWLELHYRNDVPFALAVLGQTGSNPEVNADVYVFNPTGDNEWNKIYINLTDYVTGLRQQQYRLFFRTVLSKDATGKYPSLRGQVRLDNIRLMHF